MSDYDNDEIISNFSQGMDRRYAANSTAFPAGAIWDGLNLCYLRDSQEPEALRGYTRLGLTDMGGRITGLADYDDGTRLIAACADGKWYERSTADFAASTGATGYSTSTDARWSFAMFYGATTAADLLIGCDGIDAPQKYTSGAGASALGGSPPATGNFPVSWIGRLWIADGDTLYGSRVNDCEQWGRANGGVVIQIDRGSGPITGMAEFAEYLVIFKRNKILTIPPTTQFNVSDVGIQHRGIGTPSQHTIKHAVSLKSAVLMFMSDNGVEALVPTSTTGGFYVKPASDAIKPLLDRRSRASMATAWADFNPDRHEYYLTYGTATTTPQEGVVGNLARSAQDRLARWTRHDMVNKTAGCMLRSSGSQIQVIGDTNGRVYQMHSGGSRNDSTYEKSLSTQAYTQGSPDRMKIYGRYFVDVETEGTYPVICRALLGRVGMKAPVTETDLVSFGGGDGWGVGGWGTAQWGGSGSSGQHIRLDTVRRGTSLRMQVSTSGTSQWFKQRQIVIESAYGAGVMAA